MYKVKITSCWFGQWREDIKTVNQGDLYDLCETPGLKIEIIEEAQQ